MSDDEEIPRERVPRSLADLEGMSEDEVIGQIARQGHHLGSTGFNFWMAELERRRLRAERAAQTKLARTMTALTWVIAAMTALVLAATITQIVLILAK